MRRRQASVSRRLGPEAWVDSGRLWMGGGGEGGEGEGGGGEGGGEGGGGEGGGGEIK